jgi:coenzyme F420-0:L-glutamate ligase
VKLIPIKSALRLDLFDLPAAVLDCIQESDELLRDGDILIVSSKFAAIAEGRVVSLDSVTPSAEAQKLAAEYKLDPALAELVLRESDAVFGGIPGFLLTVKDNLIAPNAGIDTSNVPAGQVVLYPENSFATAERLRAELRAAIKTDVGVVLTDSRLMPGRTGTTGVALGVAGFLPVVDERGKPDLLGRPLQVSQRAVADNLCAAAELLMGEAAEGIPLVIARGSGIPLTKDRYTWRDLAIDYQQDIYVAILGKKSP